MGQNLGRSINSPSVNPWIIAPLKLRSFIQRSSSSAATSGARVGRVEKPENLIKNLVAKKVNVKDQIKKAKEVKEVIKEYQIKET